MKKVKTISSLDELGLVQPVVINKTKTEWRDELVKFGFKCLPNFRFAISYQYNPLYVAMAEDRFAGCHGTNPRIIVPRNWKKDRTFRKVIESKGINILESNGLFVEGFGFADHRSVEDIGSFIGDIELEYRRLMHTN